MTPEAQKAFHQIQRKTGKAIGDFDLIEAGDRIAVGVSGGKDSYTLLHVLEALRKKAPVKFELVAINIDSGFPGYQKEQIEAHLLHHGFNYQMAATNAYQIIEEKLRPGTSYCAFCARLRRGSLYSQAEQHHCNKVALGHHLDDVIETLLLNQFYAGTLSAMSAKLLADNGKHTVIRPLVYTEETEIQRFSNAFHFPIVNCSCPVVAQEDQKRQRMKQLVHDLAREIPEIRRSMIAAISNVHPRHLLDKNYVTTRSHPHT
ncbi:tRNA 2-thiocytidine biosynthesis protein TtcA [Desulfuromusa kysingii]|uniref:tRNA 2-thiocytidine biosynthesis protein TtcA n=1 Tax=Desulfuromusa kysingii TaxID=37625 RepID=A0A1H3VRW5_9BACT|nr:tRNA 2-thiocytidine(32) synthetase TtcA [Desulfuromusa kysingii]SDZ76984.1 tRNA 2-thiocytidine biosynthesis protein TtcA [Desulfuromusa kysingii]